MRIEQLEYLAAVARLGSFRRAAEELHVSQPALSEAVRNLERELGVSLLERGRHGAGLSETGREMLPHIRAVLDAVDRLRQEAGAQHRSISVLRIGTVNATTVPLLTPAIRELRLAHQATQVEIVGALRDDIHRGILAGSLDLAVVNYLAGEDRPPGLEATTLLSGRPVVCLRPDHPLATLSAIRARDLSTETLIVMRSGYLMHQFVHRLMGPGRPDFSCSAEGAEMGKKMAAEGLGLTVLPDFSVVGDPLVRNGALTWRPIADDDTRVDLVALRAASHRMTRAARDLHRHLVAEAAAYAAGQLDRGAAAC